MYLLSLSCDTAANAAFLSIFQANLESMGVPPLRSGVSGPGVGIGVGSGFGLAVPVGLHATNTEVRTTNSISNSTTEIFLFLIIFLRIFAHARMQRLLYAQIIQLPARNVNSQFGFPLYSNPLRSVRKTTATDSIKSHFPRKSL